MFNRIFCVLSRHTINRHRVWHDGLEFRTKCARCAAPLVRDASGWRAYREQLDDDSRRSPHPRSA